MKNFGERRREREKVEKREKERIIIIKWREIVKLAPSWKS
jgi:hypothetical protein